MCHENYAVCLLVAVCAVCGAGRRRQGFQNRRVPFSCRVRRVFRRVPLCVAVCRHVRRVPFRWTLKITPIDIFYRVSAIIAIASSNFNTKT